ncbi:MAG: hypothetical protein ABW360_19455, partial [Phenylobacterium sp.]
AVAALKARIEANRATCDLFNMDKLTAGLEDLYFQMAAEQARGELPKPELVNMAAYLEAGLDHEHELQELTGEVHYHEGFKARLAQRHRLRPLQADSRLWTADDIATVERPSWAAEVEAPTPLRRAARR